MSSTSSSASIRSADTHLSGYESWQKLRGLIASTKFCMLVTAEADGTLRSRPMATQATDYEREGELWFFTKQHSGKVEEMKAHPNVNLAFEAQGETLFISVSGKGEVVLDRQKMKDMWNPVLKAWFPKELEDPELALLRVRVTEAEYWDNTSNTLVQLYGYIKAAVSGQPHTGEMQDHDKIHIEASKQ